MLNVYDFFTVQLPNFFFLNQFVVFHQLNILICCKSTKYLNIRTKKAQFNLFSLPKESCSVSGNSLRCYRGAKLIICILETGLGTVDFSIGIKRKTSKHMQHVIVEDQISSKNFQRGCSSFAVDLFGSSFHTLEGPL